MTSTKIAADRLRAGMKIVWRQRWVRLRTVQFGTRTTICWNGGSITVDQGEEFEVLLTPNGGYDFSDHNPDAASSTIGLDCE